MLFAITEKEKSGAIFCYKKDSMGYILMDKLDVDGGVLCHISYSPKNKTLFGACYEKGHVLAISSEAYKFLKIQNSFIINPENNTSITRSHCCMPDNDENRVFVCNIALDRVYVFNVKDGFLKGNDKFPYIQLEKGNGPRHLRFHPKLDIAYVITEYSNMLITLTYDKSAGELKECHRVSALPESFCGTSYCSTMSLSTEGKYLYAANRGADTVSVFILNDIGLPQKIQDFDCGGNWPRHIDITKDGKFLMAANQKSNDISVISISEKDGRLKKHITNLPFHAPSFVAEIRKK